MKHGVYILEEGTALTAPDYERIFHPGRDRHGTGPYGRRSCGGRKRPDPGKLSGRSDGGTGIRG